MDEFARKPLDNRCDESRPSGTTLRELRRKRIHQTAIPVALLEKRIPRQRLTFEPIQHKGINVRPNGLHQITSKTVSIKRIDMHNADAGIEPQGRGCQARLGFENGIQVVQDGVNGI
jgi:hypothetical protein